MQRETWVFPDFESPNLFLSNIRKKYGKILEARTWESTKNGYPHIHLLLLFKDHRFTVIKHYDNKKGDYTYRIPYHEKKEISRHWHSNIDIEVVNSIQGGVKELTKYITKDLCSKKGDITNAMIWYFQKQSYHISKGLVEEITGKDLDLDPPVATDLINQMCNSNQEKLEWEFLGILRGKQLGFCKEIWTFDMNKPPPSVLDLIKKENLRWRTTRS